MWFRVGQIVGLIIGFTAVMDHAWGQGPATGPAAEFRPGGYPENYYSGVFYPGTELRALPGARAQAVVAAAEFRRALVELDQVILEIRRQFMRSPEVKAALVEQQAAFDELNAIRDRAMASLRDDPTYRAAVDLKNRLAEQLETADERKVPMAERMAMATVKLSYAATVTAMEAAAIGADPQVAPARQRLVAAGKRLAEMYEQLDDMIRTSPQVLAARKAVQDTRIAAVGTEALFVEARNVATVAMKYAYNIYERPNPYVLNTPIYGGYAPVIRAGHPIGYPVGYPYTWWSSPGHGR